MATFAYVLNRDVCGFFEAARARLASRARVFRSVSNGFARARDFDFDFERRWTRRCARA